jgi:hypothetical protein
MAENNDNAKIPETTKVSAMDIPNLKKKEKERKKGGVAWGGAGRAGAWEGATGGAGRAAASAAAEGAEGALAEGAAAEGAAAGAEFGESFLGRMISSVMSRLEGTFLGRLLNPILRLLAEIASTAMGRAALAAVAALLAAGAVVLAMKLMGGSGQVASVGAPNLGDISSSIRVHGPGDDSLKMEANANRGSLQDIAKADKAAKADKPADAAKTDKIAPVDAGPAAQNADMAPMAGAHVLNPHLSGDLGGGMQSGAAGSYSSNMNFGKLSTIKGGYAGFNKSYASGRLAQSSYHAGNGMSLGRRGLIGSRALGQARTMGAMTGATMTGTADSQSAAATTMFEGSVPTGTAPPDASAGATPGTGSTGSTGNTGSTSNTGTTGNTGTTNTNPCTDAQQQAGMVPTNGVCACAPGQSPDPTNPSGCSVVTSTDGGTPGWQAAIQSAESLMSSAKNLLIVASAIVLAMWALAVVWWCTCCAFIGWIFAALALLLGAIFAMIINSMASQLQQIATTLQGMGGLATDYVGPLNSFASQLSNGADMLMIPFAGGIIGLIDGLQLDPTLPMNATAAQQTAAAPAVNTNGNTVVTGSGGDPNSFSNLGTQSGTGSTSGTTSTTGSGNSVQHAP